MQVGVPKEGVAGEMRVAMAPESVEKLVALGYRVQVEQQAGSGACFADEEYVSAGAEVVDCQKLWGASDLIVKINPPSLEQLAMAKEGASLVSFIWPAQNADLMTALKDKNMTALAMDCVPRISRAQKLDALSSMANIAGYRSTIEAAAEFGRFFTGQITAAGKTPPAKVLVIGAGVAGLAAIGTARGLGAIVRAFDTRPEVKEQVASMGAEFLELAYKEDGSGEGGYAKVMSEEFIRAEMELFAAQAKDVDIIITTAMIPGQKAPILITEEMVKTMAPGSVIVDLAAERGGNCALTIPSQKISKYGVTILGYTDYPSRLATQASRLYGNNLVHLISDMTDAARGWQVDINDEVVRGALVTFRGELMWPPPYKPAPAKPKPMTDHQPEPILPKPPPRPKGGRARIGYFFWFLAFIAMALLGQVAPAEFMNHFTVFILSVFIGWQVIWNVTPALHTPLMSVTNAISGIIIVGAMLQISDDWQNPVTILAVVAIFIASINIAGGFLVTQRMLNMFKKD